MVHEASQRRPGRLRAGGRNVSRSRQNRLLTRLVGAESWVTAASLADYLGVTPRSVRTYVAALNTRVTDGVVVESGALGYRAGPAARAAQQEDAVEPGTPRARLHQLVRRLLESEVPLDVHDTADEIYVSSATVEGDLARVRSFVSGSGLTLERRGSLVWFQGTEMAHRRVLSRLVHDQTEMKSLDFPALMRVLGEGRVGADAYARFKADLVEALGRLGYFVNEYAIADVLMHVAIAADRISRGRPLTTGVADLRGDAVAVGEVLDELAIRHFGIRFNEGDREFLSAVVLSRLAAPRLESVQAVARERVDPRVRQAVQDACDAAAAEFLVDLSGEDFTWRLVLHVQNLVERVADEAWSRNPLTRTLKASYPMIFEVAVYIATRLQERLGIPLVDEEIAYIAMHVGARLERNRSDGSPPTATIVCPGYHDLDSLLRSSLDRSLGRTIQVVRVETRADPDWDGLDTDLVLTTIAPPERNDRIVPIPLFLTDADVERVHTAAMRVRRIRRLARLRAELEKYFAPSSFVRDLDPDAGEEAIIRRLGAHLVAEGVIDDSYVERTIEREQMSSTAFTDALAVPHALSMTASRTAIAVGMADRPIPWGESRVQVVVMVAFSESDRAAFQTVFEQLVEVFSEHDSVQRLVHRGTDFPAFLDELVAVIDG
ncbi:BglG family transcription antiterminator [Propionicimonas sp.]|uniref:BglG family transcription antiterminator n=1 Tax=Propionicimonas sp. TaxID=1955623 RepID=UPI003D0F850A